MRSATPCRSALGRDRYCREAMRTQAQAPSPMPASERSRYPTTKVMRRFTRHTVMSPVSLVTALISFTHTPLLPFPVSDVFFRPWRTAPSTLFSPDALTSLTLATVSALLHEGPNRHRH